MGEPSAGGAVGKAGGKMGESSAGGALGTAGGGEGESSAVGAVGSTGGGEGEPSAGGAVGIAGGGEGESSTGGAVGTAGCGVGGPSVAGVEGLAEGPPGEEAEEEITPFAWPLGMGGRDLGDDIGDDHGDQACRFLVVNGALIGVLFGSYEKSQFFLDYQLKHLQTAGNGPFPIQSHHEP